MGLNCKQGDLAIVVKSYAGNEGKIVRCIRLIPAGFGRFRESLGPLWEVDVELNIVDENGLKRPPVKIATDAHLRPIKPLDELDDVTRDEEVSA